MNIKVVLFLISIAFIVSAQNNNFNWLIGKWKMDSQKTEVYEEWQRDGNRIKGESYKINDGQKQISETLFLENFSGQWAYIALPKGQTIALFALVESKDDKYIFENKEHDFPQRIIYHFDGDKTINVSVEADNDGENKKFGFSLIKVD